MTTRNLIIIGAVAGGAVLAFNLLKGKSPIDAARALVIAIEFSPIIAADSIALSPPGTPLPIAAITRDTFFNGDNGVFRVEMIFTDPRVIEDPFSAVVDISSKGTVLAWEYGDLDTVPFPIPLGF